MSIFSWFRPRREPSEATIQAKKRLEAVYRDDERIARVRDRRRAITKENHLGPMVERALRGKS